MQLTLVETKFCRDCGVEKPLENFTKHPTARDGHRNQCRACRGAKMKAYDVAHADQLREQRRKRYEANRDEVIAERKAFRASNAERLSAQRRARHQEKLEHNRALARARYARNPTPHLEACKARKFRRRQINVEVLLERDRGFCGICGLLVDLEDFHIDHIVPRVLGGSNEYENLQLAHPFCNQSKNKTAY